METIQIGMAKKIFFDDIEFSSYHVEKYKKRQR